MTAATTTTRKQRANGAVSRRKILDAAREIAGERGYEGTSINLVSERSGLPVSSIYWHFRDKDELIAAVIDHSFAEWVERLREQPPVVDEQSPEEQFRLGLRRTGQALEDFPDFLRLGLMLVLERRPDEPTARAKYIEAREVTLARTALAYTAVFPDLHPEAIGELAMLTIALADGLFIANQVEGISLERAFDLIATTIQATAARLARH